MMNFGQQHPEWQADTEKNLQVAVIPRGDAIITYTPGRTFRAYCIAWSAVGTSADNFRLD